jgi:uncharacterized damage-inducible protein DinB
MNRLLIALVLVAIAIHARPLRATAAEPDVADHTDPSYDMKSQALADLQVVQKKLLDLANAVPERKFTWRPSADSRSFAELFLHVAGERYQILAMMSAASPLGFNAKAFEKMTTEKARIVDELNRSWEFAQRTISGMNNADFANPLPKLGPQANAGDVVYILIADAHEHLGQSIAYARENGIVPPWTAEPQKKVAEKNTERK